MSFDERPPCIAYRIRQPIKMDGTLSDPAWRSSPKSPSFVDMETGEAALFDTQCSILWDDENLYIGFWVDDPYPKAKHTERDSIIFQENDIEVFIDGGDCYYEFEINALNTIYEVFFIWKDAYKRGDRFDLPEFDLVDRKAFSFAGDYDRTPEHFWRGTHPRGPRWAFLDWDFPGVKSFVHVDGCLNDPTTASKGWTVELAFPWSGMKHLSNGRSLPPVSGDIWRMFLGRFQKIEVDGKESTAAWCCTPHGVFDTHMPEKFTAVQFVDQFSGEA